MLKGDAENSTDTSQLATAFLSLSLTLAACIIHENMLLTDISLFLSAAVDYTKIQKKTIYQLLLPFGSHIETSTLSISSIHKGQTLI
jgi:hypothetical protein